MPLPINHPRTRRIRETAELPKVRGRLTNFDETTPDCLYQLERQFNENLSRGPLTRKRGEFYPSSR